MWENQEVRLFNGVGEGVQFACGKGPSLEREDEKKKALLKRGWGGPLHSRFCNRDYPEELSQKNRGEERREFKLVKKRIGPRRTIPSR